MAVALQHLSLPDPGEPELPPLENGDHLDQKTFHARYEAMPPGTRAELIGGVVFMPSPVRLRHANPHQQASFWLGLYSAETSGTLAALDATTILGEYSEPQPDMSLSVLPEAGGQTSVEDDYLVGCPELVVEVASSRESYDLHEKRRDYEAAGALEYLVLLTREQRALWLVNRGEQFEELKPDSDGIHRSKAFPGFWLDAGALFRSDGRRLREVVEQGLATPEHAAFVEQLRVRMSEKA